MSNKNPFEIRAEMLHMAKDYMDRQWETNWLVTQQLFEQGKATAEEVKVAMQPYSVEAMMEKAKELSGLNFMIMASLAPTNVWSMTPAVVGKSVEGVLPIRYIAPVPSTERPITLSFPFPPI